MNRQRFQGSFRVLLLAAVLALPAAAQAQSELNTPYDLTIVVHVAENRMLTDVFRGRIERELHDGFQAALGDMGRVKVTHKHPRLADVLARGLRSLDEWKERDDKKTHFVLIDYSGVHYEIQTRQYDGTVGRASPVVRRDRTRDRDFVAKAAALLLKHDFGAVGTVLTDPEGTKKKVKVELRGGGLGDMSRWVKKDDVFLLAPPSGGSPLALRWSLLQVEQAPTEEARDGMCECRFFNRYELPSIAGYRCIKVGTVRTLLRVRWIQKMPNGRIKPPDQRLNVDIRRYGFEGGEALSKTSDLNGIMETVRDKDGVFDNVAFVHVVSGLGEKNTPMVPVPLYDDQPVYIEVIPSRDFDSLFDIRKARWQSEVASSVHAQEFLFQSLQKLAADPEKRGETIQLANSGRKRAQADRKTLAEERQALAELATKNRKELKTPLEDRRLKQLETYEKVLSDFIEEQEKIEKTENDPQLKKWRSEIERAKLLEKELEYTEAIKIYERVQAEGFPDKDGDLKKHLAQLHKLWDPRNGEHKDARGFIYRVWPKLDTSRLEENIPKAQQAFKTCKDAGDVITIQKLLKGTEVHAERLAKSLAELHPELVIDDEKEAQQIKKISEPIVKLFEEIQDYLKAHADEK
jgi:hypothetical protein